MIPAEDDTSSVGLTMPRAMGWVLRLVAVYFLFASGSLYLNGHAGHVATLWFANPVGTVALLALPVRQWPVMLGGLALGNVAANMAVSVGAHGLGSAVWLSAAAFVPGNCGEMLLAAILLRRLKVGPGVLKHSDQLARVLVFGALVPTLFSGFAGAALLSSGDRSMFAALWVTWFAGSLIGTVAVLPLVLSIWLQGWGALRKALGQTHTQGLILLSVAVTLLAATTLSKPFVVMVIPVVLLAARSDFSVTALISFVTAVMIGALIDAGVLVAPPSSTWWGDSLFYISVLATLLPGLFLAASVEGRVEAMRQLAANEQKFRSLYTRTPAMLHSIDQDGRIISVSQRWLETLGYAEHEVLGRLSTDFLAPDSARRAREDILPRTLLEGHCDDVELQMVTRDGRVLDVLLSALWEYGADGSPLHRLTVIQDVTEKKRLAARSHFAEHDALTGLPNRVLMHDRLERNCSHHDRYGGTFAVGFLDLDHFKSVNDTYGHEAGDALLKEVALRLQSALRGSDTVCRLGGDEFVLLFAAVEGADDLQTLSAKVLGQLARPCQLGSAPDAPWVDVAGSMGVAVFPEHGRDPKILLQHADQAMYEAKRGGRNHCVFYHKPATLA